MYRVYKVAGSVSILILSSDDHEFAYGFCRENGWVYRDDPEGFEWDLEIEPDDREMID